MDINEATAPPPVPSGAPSADDRQWGMFAHLSALSGVVIPFGNIIGPLVVWQVKKDTLPFAADQGMDRDPFWRGKGQVDANSVLAVVADRLTD